MVTQWGMSDKIGPLFHSEDNDEVFLGYSMGKNKHISEETANLIDSEVKSIVEEGYALAQNILKENMDDLHKLAKGLIEYETLSGDEIKDLLSGKKLRKSTGSNNDGKGKKATPKKTSVPKIRNRNKNKTDEDPGSLPQEA